MVGAGYAGMMAALRLSGRIRGKDTEIILVNAVPNFVERPCLHLAATGHPMPERSIEYLIRKKAIRFIQGRVTSLLPQRKEIILATPAGKHSLFYQKLVYALGSEVDQDAVPGIREHAYVLDSGCANGWTALKSGLQNVTGKVVVIGGGATGIEAVTQIRSHNPRLSVRLVTSGQFGDFKGPRVEQHLRQAFEQQDIEISEGRAVIAVEPGAIKMEGGQQVGFNLAVWAGGFKAPGIAKNAGLKVNEKKQVLVDPFGRSISHPDIYAIGDASHPVVQPEHAVRMSLLTAVTRGVHAADNIRRELMGKSLSPLGFAYYGQGIALGDSDAIGFLGYPDDNPHGIILRGKMAVRVRNFFVKLFIGLLEMERRLPGFYLIMGKRRYGKIPDSTVYEYQEGQGTG